MTGPTKSDVEHAERILMRVRRLNGRARKLNAAALRHQVTVLRMLDYVKVSRSCRIQALDLSDRLHDYIRAARYGEAS